MMPTISQETIDAYKRVSTPTLATALFKRGFRNQVIQGVQPVGKTAGTMVGPAYTLRYIPAREDLNQITVFLDPAHIQRRAVEECPSGAVLVMDSRKDARAASGGGILLRRLMVRGCAGVVTDGGFRDSAEIGQFEMPAFHQRPSPPTNLTLHHAMDLNVPIGCGDAAVFPGDLIVGDADGVIVVPAHLAEELLPEVLEMERYESFVVDMVREGNPVIGLYPLTNDDHRHAYAEWLGKKGQ